MSKIKIGNQDVELEVVKVARDLIANYPGTQGIYDAFSTAIKEAEGVEGPFGFSEDGELTFHNEVVRDIDGDRIYMAKYIAPTINRILSQHFVLKDELRGALGALAANRPLAEPMQFRRLRNDLAALIEKGQNDE